MSGLHTGLGAAEIHIPYNWSYADAATRIAATGFVAADVGKLAYQQDEGSFWILTDDSPVTWLFVGGEPPEVVLSEADPILIDVSLGRYFRVEITGDHTLDVPTGVAGGVRQRVITVYNSDGSDHTLSLNTGAGGFRFGSDVTGTTATIAGETDYLTFIWNATDSKWDVVGYTKGF
jgi:hypothetical protein